MQENEFEKKVQQRMEEFRLRPSEAVWGAVAHSLVKKRRRRIVVFFVFLLAGLGLAGFSGYYFLSNQSKPGIVEQTSTPPKKTSSSVPSIQSSELATRPSNVERNGSLPELNTSVPDNTLSKTGEQVFPDQEKMVEEGKVISPESSEPVAKKTVKRLQPDIRNTKPTAAIAGAGKQKYQKKISENVPANELSENKSQDKKIIEEKTEIALSEKLAEDAPANTFVTPVTDSAIQADVAKSTEPELEVDKPKTDVPKSAKRSKLKWGLDFSVGAVNGSSSALSFGDSQKNFDALLVSGPPVQGFPGGTAYFPPQPPSPTNAGLGFKIGPVAEMELSNRSRVSFGAQYSYMTTRVKIGTYRPTTLVINNSFSQSVRVDAAYQGTYQKNHTNRYHFVHLPLTYHLQLNKGEKLPIDWKVGMAPGYLFATNAVLYDSVAGGIYYKDNNAYNRFQFNLHTGIDFRFDKGKRLQWSVGPEISMAMTKLVDDPYTKRQYLLYGGIRGKLFFSKKK